MIILGYVYRVVSNFAFLALVYYSLNFMEKYNQRAVVAILVLVYASMRGASALRSFYFFQKIERLELEARRLAAVAGEAGAAAQQEHACHTGHMPQGMAAIPTHSQRRTRVLYIR